MTLQKTTCTLFLLAFLTALCSCSPREQDTSGNTAIIPEQRDGRAYERFLMLNERVQENQGEIDLLFIGDSITERWETIGKEIWQEYYGDLKALNLGIGADRTQHLLWRLENGNIDGIKPKVAVVLIGTNNLWSNGNTTSETHDGVVSVIKKLLVKLPDSKILLLGIFPRGKEYNIGRGKIAQINQTLRLLEERSRVSFLDFSHNFLNPDGSIPESLMPDALHLSEEGYRIWAEAMEPLIEDLLSN